MMDERDKAIRDALRLLRSAVQSREPWTEACDDAYEEALDDLASLMAELRDEDAPALRQEDQDV